VGSGFINRTACAVLAACRLGRLRRHSYRLLVPVVLAMFVAGGLHIISISPAFQRGPRPDLVAEVDRPAA
jgi:hypothetical protein